MIIDSKCTSVCGNYGKVILKIVRAVVFAFAELGDGLVVAGTHDRGPTTVTVVVTRCGSSIVA